MVVVLLVMIITGCSYDFAMLLLGVVATTCRMPCLVLSNVDLSRLDIHYYD